MSGTKFAPGRTAGNARVTAMELMQVYREHVARHGGNEDTIAKAILEQSQYMAACAEARESGRPDPQAKRGNPIASLVQAVGGGPQTVVVEATAASDPPKIGTKVRAVPKDASAIDVARAVRDEFADAYENTETGELWASLDETALAEMANQLVAVFGAKHVCDKCVRLEFDSDFRLHLRVFWAKCAAR